MGKNHFNDPDETDMNDRDRMEEEWINRSLGASDKDDDEFYVDEDEEEEMEDYEVDNYLTRAAFEDVPEGYWDDEYPAPHHMFH